jgi:hypothetical protein
MTALRGRFLDVEVMPSASYSMILRVEFPHRGGTLGAILTAVGEAGAGSGRSISSGCGTTGAYET